jgi:hypothetical protein
MPGLQRQLLLGNEFELTAGLKCVALERRSVILHRGGPFGQSKRRVIKSRRAL